MSRSCHIPQKTEISSTITSFQKIVTIGLFSVPVVFSGLISNRLLGYSIYILFKNNGYTYMKIGQWLASRPDILGKNVCRYLKKLNSDAPTHDIKHTINVLNEELLDKYDITDLFNLNNNEKVEPGSKKYCFFKNIFGGQTKPKLIIHSKIPIGSGCIAQVYKGKINNQNVAVKILHPNIDNKIRNDISVVLSIFRFLKIDPSFLHQFRIDTINQTDLRNEAKNLKILTDNFIGNKYIKIPCVFYKSKNLLIEEFIETYNEKEKLTETNKNKLVYAGQNLLSKMIFKDKFFHADLHPGNIFVTKEDNLYKLALIDAGICRSMTNTEYKNLLDFLYETLFVKNHEKAASLLIERKKQDFLNAREDFIVKYSSSAKKIMCGDFNQVKILYDLLKYHGVALDYGYSSLLTTLSCFDGFMRQLSLDPYKDFYKVFWINTPYEYFIHRFIM